MEKKRATRKVMRLVDSSTGKMECRVCGSVHWANLESRPGKWPVYQRGSWQCVDRCSLDDMKDNSAETNT